MMNVVCFGDSITYASGAEIDRWPTILQMQLEALAPGKFKVYNKGIGGNTTAMGFDRFAADVRPLLPAAVLIEFGFNDCNIREEMNKSRVGILEFELNLREFQRLISVSGGTAVFIVNHPITQARADLKLSNGAVYGENFYKYNAVIKKVAQELGAPFIDLPEIIKSRKIDIASFTSDDGLHLSIAGNHAYAGIVFDALKDLLA